AIASIASALACGDRATTATVLSLPVSLPYLLPCLLPSCLPLPLVQPTSTQSRVRCTAFCQPAYPLVRCSSVHCGSHRLSSFQFWTSSSLFFQKPTARPAAYAAPSAVVSATTGLLTGTPRMSACICMQSWLAGEPPSTFSTSTFTPESFSIASATSLLW